MSTDRTPLTSRHLVRSGALGLVAFALAAGAPASDLPSAALRLRPGVVHGGEPAQASLTFASPLEEGARLEVSLAGSNAVQAQPTRLSIAAGGRDASFVLSTSPVASRETVEISVTAQGGRYLVAGARLSVEPPALAALALDHAECVGGSPSCTVTGTVTLAGRAAAPGLDVQLGQTCPACGPHEELELPAAVRVGAGSTSASFTFQPRAHSVERHYTVLASLESVVKTAAFTDTTLRPQAIAVSPSSVTGTQSATVTITLNAPAYAGYRLQIECSPSLLTSGSAGSSGCYTGSSARPPAEIAVAGGQTSVSFQVHLAQPPSSPTQVTLEAQGLRINGEVQTTMTITP